MNQPKRKSVLRNTLLGVLCVLGIGVFVISQTRDANAAGSPAIATFTGIQDNTETIQTIKFSDKSNLETIVGQIYASGSGNSRTLVVTPTTIVAQSNEGANISSGYSQILGGMGINIDSNNITIIGGSKNSAAQGNDNATLAGGMDNVLSENSGETPAVLIGGRGNTIGENQDGNVIVGGSGNTIGEDVSHSQILGGEGNEVKADNTIVAGSNVKNENAENSFVFSNFGNFEPQSSNSFYINSEYGVGINGEEYSGGISSQGGVYIGNIDVDNILCDVNNIGLQGTYSGCLIGCTTGSALSGKWDLLESSEACIEKCKDKSDTRCVEPIEKETFTFFPSYCIGTGDLDLGGGYSLTQCTGFNTAIDQNSVFYVDLVEVCPDTSDKNQVANPCTYVCPEGYSSSGNGCKKSCELPWDHSQLKEHGTTITSYYGDSVVCNTGGVSCLHNLRPLACDNGDRKYLGQIKTGASLDNYKQNCGMSVDESATCPSDFVLDASELTSGGVYTGCSNFSIEDESCVAHTKYKFVSCDTGYTLGSDGVCHPDCTFNGIAVHYGQTITGYMAESVVCEGNTTFCGYNLLKCGANGSFEGNLDLIYTKTGCSLSGVVPPSQYNLTACPVAKAASGTTTSTITENTPIGVCNSYTGYNVVNNQCVAHQRYELVSCIAGYTKSGDNCLPNCILPRSTSSLQYGVENSNWSGESIVRGASITGYKLTSTNCPSDSCVNTGNWALMTCGARGVLSGSATYVYKNCTTHPLLNLTGYNRTAPVANAECLDFQPYKVVDNNCNPENKTYKCTQCKTGYTLNGKDLVGGDPDAACLKDCSFIAQPGSRTITLSGWVGSTNSSIVTYSTGSFTCPSAYTGNNQQTRQCNNGVLSGTYVYTSYTQTGYTCAVINDGTRTGIRTLNSQISNATQVQTYCVSYKTGSSPVCQEVSKSYYYKCNTGTYPNGFQWSTTQNKCVQCTGSIPDHAHYNNSNYPESDTTTFYYSTNTSLACTYSCDADYYWDSVNKKCYRHDCVIDNGTTSTADDVVVKDYLEDNRTVTIYKSSSTICKTACDAKTVTCKDGTWYDASNNVVTGYNYSTCSTKTGYVLGSAAPVAGQCSVTGDSGSKGNKVFTNTTYTGGNATSVPTKRCTNYGANNTSCTTGNKYYVYFCSGSYHRETVSGKLQCASDTKSVQCTQQGKPDNSSYVIANVTVTWNSSTNSYNTAENCSWKCNSGYYKNGSACTKCEAGNYCPGDDNKYTCPSGSYCPAGAGSATSCTTLGSNYKYSATGSSANTACYMSVTCGKYKTTATGNTISGCGAGKYSLAHNSYYGSGDNSCASITAGYYGTSACSAKPTACGAGKWSATGSSTCSDIDAGCYGTSATKSCPASCVKSTDAIAGTYSTGGAASCTVCGNGTYAASGGASSCSACPAGSYCAGGKIVACTTLGSNYKHSATGSTAASACYMKVTCGNYKTAATGNNTAGCGAGKYSLAHNSYYGSGDSSCAKISAGYYGTSECSATASACGSGQWSAAGSSTCSDISCGYYGTNAGSATSTACPAGTYSATGASSCTNCAKSTASVAGTYSATGACSCTTASNGYYTTTAKATTQTLCAAGSYCTGGKIIPCAAGTYSTTGATSCTSCVKSTSSTAGTYQSGTGKTSCTTASNGYYTTANKATAQTPCPAGSACPGGKIVACSKSTSTVAGTYTTTTGQSSCTTAADGYYTTSANATGSTPCPAGSYCAGGKIQTCPSGYTSNLASKTQSQCYKTLTATFSKGTGVASISATSGTCKMFYGSGCSVTAATVTCSSGYSNPSWSKSLTNLTSNITSTATCQPNGCTGPCGSATNGNSLTCYVSPQLCNDVSTSCLSQTRTCKEGAWYSGSTQSNFTSTYTSSSCTLKATCTSSTLTSCPSGCECVGCFAYSVSSNKCVSNGTKYDIFRAKAGYYQTGNTCTQCPAGTYSETGATSCTSCPGGFTSPAGSTSVTQCYKQFTVTYNANGATSVGKSSDSCQVKCTSATNCETSCTVTAPSITRANFNIRGWSTSSSATSASVSSGGTITLSANKTYYAITDKTVTVTLTKGTGVKSISKSSVSCMISNSATSCSISSTPTITCNSGYGNGTWSRRRTGFTGDTTSTATCTSTSCTGPCGTVADGESLTCFAELCYMCSTSQKTCPSETRKCSNGQWLDCSSGLCVTVGEWELTMYNSRSICSIGCGQTCELAPLSSSGGVAHAIDYEPCNKWTVANPNTQNAQCTSMVVRYRVTECESGYTVNAAGSACVANACSGCPSGTVSNGGTCTSYARCDSVKITSTCNNGTWNRAPGEYSRSNQGCYSCSASGACSAKSDGGTCTSYAKCSSTKITSTCNDGTWSTTPGAYSSANSGCASCAASGGCPATAHGGTCTTYADDDPTGGACLKITSTCNNGTWEGDASPGRYTSCTAYCSASGGCSKTAAGGTCTTYAQCSSTKITSTCQSSGKWNKTPGAYSSANSGCVSCAASGGCPETAHGGTCTTYANNAPTGSACSPTVSTCNNGTWSTTPKAYSTCTAWCAASGGCGKTAAGLTCTTYSNSKPSCPSLCIGLRSTCQSDGTWDNTPDSYSSCAAQTFSCSLTTYPLTSKSDANALSYDSCTSYTANIVGTRCTAGSTRYKITSCATNYKPNSDGSECVPTCFPAGTQVTMADGSTKNIENIQTGDVVLTYNEETHEVEPNEILSPIVHPDSTDEMYELTINGEILKVTYAHRFYVVISTENDEESQCSISYQRVEAQNLKVGDLLMMVDGSYARISHISHYPNLETVYNLSVANNHNYFVGEGYLVHNAKILIPDDPVEIGSCNYYCSHCFDTVSACRTYANNNSANYDASSCSSLSNIYAGDPNSSMPCYCAKTKNNSAEACIFLSEV